MPVIEAVVDFCLLMSRPSITVIETRGNIICSLLRIRTVTSVINQIIDAKRFKNLITIIKFPIRNGDVVIKVLLDRRGRLPRSLKWGEQIHRCD